MNERSTILCALIIFAPISRCVKFLPAIPTALYYAIIGICGLYMLTRGRDYEYSKYSFALLVFCAISLVVNTVHENYHAGERLLGLTLTMVACGPLLRSDFADCIRYRCVNIICFASIIICIISSVIYAIAPGLCITERGQLYGGITSHSMLLSPLAGIGAIFSFTKLFESVTKKEKYIWGIITVICMLNCLQAGSKSALAATLSGLLLWLWINCENNKKRFFEIASAIVIVASITFPFWNSYTDTIQKKLEYSEQQGSMFATRQGRWDVRIFEIEEKPIFGWGFGTTSQAVSERGTIEPGSGWLFVWSSSGIFAFLCFLSLYIHGIINTWRQREYLSLILCLLVFFGIHGIAEGYYLSAGNVLCFVFWLVMGCSYIVCESDSNN